MSNTPTTNMTIPVHMVAQVEQFMNSLSVEPINSAMDISEDEEDTQCGEDTQCEEDTQRGEVEKVLAHYVCDGVWWFFELQFKNGEIEMVADEECDCEFLISNYLAEKNINTAYIFCRVSTKEQASSTSISLEAQEAELRPLVTKYPRVKVLKISCSAYRKMPQVLVDIGECAKCGDGIFVWRVDRLSRNIVKYLGWLEDLNNNGVELYSANDGLYYSSNKTDFIQAVLDAQKEAELLGARVRLVNKRKKQRGDEAIGSLPFGKKYDRILDAQGNTVRKIVVPHPEEIAWIEFIRNSAVDPKNLADQLNNKGYLKRGKKWSQGMIKNMRK